MALIQPVTSPSSSKRGAPLKHHQHTQKKTRLILASFFFYLIFLPSFFHFFPFLLLVRRFMKFTPRAEMSLDPNEEAHNVEFPPPPPNPQTRWQKHSPPEKMNTSSTATDDAASVMYVQSIYMRVKSLSYNQVIHGGWRSDGLDMILNLQRINVQSYKVDINCSTSHTHS